MLKLGYYSGIVRNSSIYWYCNRGIYLWLSPSRIYGRRGILGCYKVEVDYHTCIRTNYFQCVGNFGSASVR